MELRSRSYDGYRLRSLFGFGIDPADGLLMDATAILPAWFPLVPRGVTTLLFLGYFIRSGME